MAARDFDDVAALVNTWRGAIDKRTPRPGCALSPALRAELHVARGLDAGRVTDGLGEQIAAEIETYLRKGSV